MSTELIELLRGLADGSIQPRIPVYGICSAIDCFLGKDERKNFIQIYRQMDRTLDPEYPVAGELEFQSPGNLWTGVRGEARRAFCTRVADYMESQ